MYNHVLIGVAPDQDAPVSRALTVARRLVRDGGRITALMVIEDMPGYVQAELPDGIVAASTERTVGRFKARLEGNEDVATAIATGHAAREIVAWAGTHGVDCILVMSHRPGLADILLGSTAANVVRHAPTAVHVLR